MTEPASASATSAAGPAAEDRTAALLALANRHEQEGRLDEADAVLDRILSAAPAAPGPLHQKGIVAFRRGRMQEAAAAMERSIGLAPGAALFHRNICEVYRALGRFDAALAAGKRAVALDPADPHCRHNLGIVHYDRLELDRAIGCAEAALDLDPDFAGGHFGIAEASLLRGDFARGWAEYEWRNRLAGVPPLLPPSDRPQCDGRPLGRGSNLLLIADQGYGDVIQFARYIPWAAARAPDIVIACSRELQPVVAQLAGAVECLDLVVTVDTAVGHLAGAMGKAVWIMLPYAPDWRWLLGRNDSPWYPTARLFRQSAERRWEPVAAAIAAALARADLAWREAGAETSLR